MSLPARRRLLPHRVPAAVCLHRTADHRLMRRRPPIERLLEEDDATSGPTIPALVLADGMEAMTEVLWT